jgi:hypothetical protein
MKKPKHGPILKCNGAKPFKSVCVCGHIGGCLVSEHEDTIEPGHGRCKVKGCPCMQFTWKSFA